MRQVLSRLLAVLLSCNAHMQAHTFSVSVKWERKITQAKHTQPARRRQAREERGTKENRREKEREKEER